VEVVHEPFRRRRDDLLGVDGLGDRAVRLEQDAPVLVDARREPAAVGRARGDLLCGGEALGMLLETLDPEQLGANGLRIVPAADRRAAPSRLTP
jgi:hypothetical protein